MCHRDVYSVLEVVSRRTRIVELLFVLLLPPAKFSVISLSQLSPPELDGAGSLFARGLSFVRKLKPAVDRSHACSEGR